MLQYLLSSILVLYSITLGVSVFCWPCRDPGGYSPACLCRVPASIPGQSTWDLWYNKCHWNRVFLQVLVLLPFQSHTTNAWHTFLRLSQTVLLLAAHSFVKWHLILFYSSGVSAEKWRQPWFLLWLLPSGRWRRVVWYIRTIICQEPTVSNSDVTWNLCHRVRSQNAVIFIVTDLKSHIYSNPFITTSVYTTPRL
jgi:hypothetical protein